MRRQEVLRKVQQRGRTVKVRSAIMFLILSSCYNEFVHLWFSLIHYIGVFMSSPVCSTVLFSFSCVHYGRDLLYARSEICFCIFDVFIFHVQPPWMAMLQHARTFLNWYERHHRVLWRCHIVGVLHEATEGFTVSLLILCCIIIILMSCLAQWFEG